MPPTCWRCSLNWERPSSERLPIMHQDARQKAVVRGMLAIMARIPVETLKEIGAGYRVFEGILS